MSKETKIEVGTTHITSAGTNIFEELGFEVNEAATLKANSDAIIKNKLSLKIELMSEIEHWIEEKSLKQIDAAHILGITRPRVSDVIRKDVKKFSIDSLVDMVARTGKHIRLELA